MKAATILRLARIVVSALCLTVVTVGLIGVPGVILLGEKAVAEVQLVPVTLGTFIAWVILTVVFGRIYCASVCPLGTMQDIVARLNFKRRYRYQPPRQGLAMFMLIAIVAAGIGGFAVLITLLNPYSEYATTVRAFVDPTLFGVAVAAVVIIVVGFMSWRWGRLFCNTVCPLGCGLGFLSRQSFFHIEINPDTCTRCGRCVDVCKASCIDLQQLTVDHSRCVTCFNCLGACRDKSIRYTPDRHRLSTPMFQPTQHGKAVTTCSEVSRNTIGQHKTTKSPKHTDK